MAGAGYAAERFERLLEHRLDVELSIFLFFSPDRSGYEPTFSGLTHDEVLSRRQLRLDQLELDFMFGALSIVEAAFRVDYEQRGRKRLKDPLSRDMRRLWQGRRERARLEDEILRVWSAHHEGSLLSDVKAAFKVRHWLAHGQYWTPKFGRRYDHVVVSTLVARIFAELPLEDR